MPRRQPSPPDALFHDLEGRDFLSPEEIARRLGVTATTVRRLRAKGALQTVLIETRPRIPVASYRAYVIGQVRRSTVQPVEVRRA